MKDDKQGIENDGITYCSPSRVRHEKEFKILKADPRRTDNAFCKFEILERKNYAAHRQVFETNQKNNTRNHHQVMNLVFPYSFSKSLHNILQDSISDIINDSIRTPFKICQEKLFHKT